MTGTEAKELLEKIRTSRPQELFGKLDAVLTGVGYVLTYLNASDDIVLAGDLFHSGQIIEISMIIFLHLIPGSTDSIT